MKKSILIIGTVVLSILNVNARNKKVELHVSNEITEVTRNNITQDFEWKVETTNGMCSGSSLSLKQAENMMQLSSSNEVITGKEIKSFFVLKLEVEAKRNYFWEVKTATGTAKGYASSQGYANKMIALVASGDAVVSKIIISQPQQ